MLGFIKRVGIEFKLENSPVVQHLYLGTLVDQRNWIPNEAIVGTDRFPPFII